MTEFFNYNTAITFILVLSRVSGTLMGAPIFSAKGVPKKFKVLFSVILSIMIFPSLPVADFPPMAILRLAILIAGQLFIGLLAGLAVSLTFAALQTAGSLMDVQIGFGMSQMVDPSTGNRATANARWLNLVAIMIFLALNGHHWLILGLVNSFKLIPVNQFAISPFLLDYIIRSFSDILAIGFNIAAPILIAIIMVDVTAGFLARTAPKLNIMILSFPFKIALGYFVMTASFGVVTFMFANVLRDLEEPLMRFFQV